MTDMIRRSLPCTVLLLFASVAFLACSRHSEHQSSDQPVTAPWPVPPEARDLKNPLPDIAVAAKRGEATFNQQCSVCHGTGGKGDGPDASRFQPPPTDLRLKRVQKETDGELYYKISNGRAPMPAFRPGLSDEERWKLVSYIHTLHE